MSYIHIVEYGAGNIASVMNMIKRAGGAALLARTRAEVLEANKILLPGVGSFDNAVEKLQKLELFDAVIDKARSGSPVFGICLGMQLLARCSEEGKLRGLNLVPGNVKRLAVTGPEIKVPHMGWNRVRVAKPHPIVAGVDTTSKFYFVHSYHFECDDPSDALLQSSHGMTFVAAVQRDNVMGVQFHPEKSHSYGMRIIKNFIDL